MKKFFFLVAVATTLVFSISSCGKDETDDLTVGIVGTYTGTVTRAGNATTNHIVKVSRISDTRVVIQPSINANASSYFYADVTGEDDGWSLNVSEFSDNGVTVTGNSGIITQHYDWHGTYTNGTLTYSIIRTEGGVDVVENYSGDK